MAVTSTRKQKSARKPRRRTRSGPARMRRWLLVPLALGIATLAFYLLLVRSSEAPLAARAPALDEIGDSSRARLEHVLRDADRAEEAAR